MSKQTDFITVVLPIGLKIARERGYDDAVAYTCASQCALECGWTLPTKTHALLGIKADKNYKGKVYNANTKECYDGVNITDVNACFRAYDTYYDSICDWFNLMTLDRYKNALTKHSVVECITEIYKGGYATDPNYINKVCAVYNTIKVIYNGNDNNLKVVNVDTVLNIREKPNTNSRVIGTLKNGTTLHGTFVYIPQFNGYVALDYVERIDANGT